MLVLITGGAGFIGSHTADLLLARGHRVRVLDSLAPPVHSGRPDHLDPRVELLEGDVRDRAAWERALAGVDAVYHLAAYQDYLPDFSTFLTVNGAGTALLYEVAVARRLRLQKVVVASSQAVYGEGLYRCPKCGPVYPPIRTLAQLEARRWEPECPSCGGPLTPDWTPEDRVNPANAYGISKVSQEQLALVLGRRYEIPSLAMRYSITQGPRQSFRNAYSGILRIFSLRLHFGLAPVCYEDGRQERDYVSVHDAARANLLALDDPRCDYRVFSVGGARRTTVLEYAELLSRVSGRDLAPELPGKFRFGDTRHIFSDVSSLAELGWKPEVGLEDVAREYWEWLESRPDLEREFVDGADRVMLEAGTVRAAGQPST
ncbi:MAG: NAD-dependent epimerase/dehydratase family protein [Candidatus Dormibacteria bacterium]